MDGRTRAALRRFTKIALAAAIPVLLAALNRYAQDGTIDVRPLLVAVATALLAGIEKGYNWQPPDPATP